jgi:hypothetical protein
MGARSLEPGTDVGLETRSEAEVYGPRVPAGGLLSYLAGWHGWYWALVPVLAVAAYVTALRVGFLADDWLLLAGARVSKLNLQAAFNPNPDWPFYRPVGSLLTWQLGGQLWGLDPLPYHLLSLLLHAGVALVFGVWVAEITSRHALGWLAGALFAVFPLHIEAVGWVAAQWDLWAALFGFLGLWFFTRWWRRREHRRFYILAVLFYGLGVFSKESLITFLPIFAATAWFVTPRLDARAWRTLALSMLPFCALLSLNVALRLATWGAVGGYPDLKTDFPNFFWEGFTSGLRLIIAPVNITILGNATAQVVGALSSMALLAGLAWYGRRHARLLLLAGAWLVLTLLPVLNLAFTLRPVDLQQNRFLYLPAAGYVLGVAVLLHAAITDARGRWKQMALAVVGALILAGVAACWVHLRPWHTATVQAEELGDELLRAVPSEPRPQQMVWYVEDVPDNYRGAYLFRLGLGTWRGLYSPNLGDEPALDTVRDAEEVDLTTDARDAFALRFRFDQATVRYHVDYAAGLTRNSPAPTAANSGAGLVVWDFTGCSPGIIGSWQVSQANPQCEPGEGLTVKPDSADPQMSAEGVEAQTATNGARFLRLRVSARYPAAPDPKPYVQEWFWHGPGTAFGGERTRAVPVKQDGEPHVYWLFIPAGEAGQAIAGLRFDPINAQIPAGVQWIALDLVR